jgi:hypothetical protein
MTRLFALLRAFFAETILGRPRRSEAHQQLRERQATRVKYPLGRISADSDEDEGEDLLRLRQEYYVRPRAYPHNEIDIHARVRAYEQLQQMRKAQEKPHIPAGWADQPGRPNTFGLGGCAWYSLGPTNINGRITNIAIDPSNNQRIFVTSVGGIWRSTDGGRRWQRVSDDFLATIFASVAVNPGTSTEVLAGGGDPNYASAGSASGLGIWRSTSGGDPATWEKVSPTELDGHVIFRLRFDPAAPNNVYAATTNGVYLGVHSGPTMTWSRLGGFDASTNDLVVDFSSTPRKVYAGVRGASTSYARGIWKYNGSSWQQRNNGIPVASGRTIALALAASDTNTLYAKIENASNGRLLGVYKSGNGANNWNPLAAASVMDDSIFLNGNGYSWYNSVLEVDPTNADIVYGGGLSIFRTLNGGTSWTNVSGGADTNFPITVHSDHHAVAFDPSNSKIVYVGDDGGIWRSSDTSVAAWHWNDISHGMVITEFYRATTQQASATVLAGGSQDNGTEITFGNRTWYQFGGCDGADVAVDSVDSLTVYSNCNGGLYEEVNPVPGTPGGQSSVTPTFPAGITWTPPIVSDSALGGRALAAGTVSATGNQRIMATTDGLTWSAISTELPAGASVQFFAIAPSSAFQTYYVGVAGGGSPTVWRTTNGGGMWATTTTGLPNLMPTGCAVDWTTPTRAFVTLGGSGGVFMTTNGGASWDGLPGSGMGTLPSASVLGVAIDPNDANTLYIATSIGVFRGTITPGMPPTASWTPFDEGLPDGLDVNAIFVNRTTGLLTIGSMGHGAFQRDINPGVTCPAAMLVVRDNVFDRGIMPSASGLPDAEHPIPDPARPGFYKPNDTTAGRVYWWSSTDIRIDVPSLDPPANQFTTVDHVEFETCPVEIAPPPPGALMDSNPIQGRAAKAYIQVTNHGLQPASNVRVIALWADATTSLPLLPNDFWTTTFPAGSTMCGPLDTSTGWNFVEPANPCRVIPVVNPALPEVVGFDWAVPATAAEHSCMLAMVESADDPINPSLRSTNETRPWVFIPNTRQIGLRNLHIVTSSSPRSSAGGMEGMNVPNPSQYLQSVEVVFGRGDLADDAQVAVLLPPGAQFTSHGLTRRPAELTDEQMRKAEQLKLDPTVKYVIAEPEASIDDLPVPPGDTWKIGLLFHSGSKPKPGTASRFTILTRQEGTVLGGSTYVLRIPTTILPTDGATRQPVAQRGCGIYFWLFLILVLIILLVLLILLLFK